jgi:hypothetical protein
MIRLLTMVLGGESYLNFMVRGAREGNYTHHKFSRGCFPGVVKQ